MTTYDMKAEEEKARGELKAGMEALHEFFSPSAPIPEDMARELEEAPYLLGNATWDRVAAYLLHLKNSSRERPDGNPEDGPDVLRALTRLQRQLWQSVSRLPFDHDFQLPSEVSRRLDAVLVHSEQSDFAEIVANSIRLGMLLERFRMLPYNEVIAGHHRRAGGRHRADLAKRQRYGKLCHDREETLKRQEVGTREAAGMALTDTRIAYEREYPPPKGQKTQTPTRRTFRRWRDEYRRTLP